MAVINEFMLNLTKQLMETRGIAESTASAYIRSLYILNNKKPFKTLTFLRNTDALLGVIAEYADNTQKSILTAIVSVLSLVKDKPAYKKLHQFYLDRLMGKKGEMEDKKGDVGEKTAKEKENWISWEEVSKIRDDLRSKVDEFKGTKLTPEQYETLLHSVILGLYTYIQPRRNQDYLDMYVIRGEPSETTENYLVLDKKNKPTHFVFNKYKTSKKYGQQKIELTPELVDVLTIFLKHHPLFKGKTRTAQNFKMLVGYDGTPLTAVNSITRILNKVFGKKVGSSMLRHIYLSSKYDIKAMEDDASKMAHSLNEQKAYLRGSGEENETVNVVVVPTME